MGTSKQLATFEQIFRGQEEGDILALLNATDAFIMVLDAKGLVLHLNSVCEATTGCSLQDAKGKYFWDLFLTAQDAKVVKAAFDLIGESQFPERYENHLIGKDGTSHWVAWKNTLIRGGEEDVKYVVSTGINISRRKQVEQSLRRRDAILEAVSFAASSFLKAGTWETAIAVVMECLGLASEVSRVTLCRNYHADDGKIMASIVYEWTAQNVERHSDESALRNVCWDAPGFNRIFSALKQGEPISGNVNDFNPAEQEIFRQSAITSMLAVPVFEGQSWWGLIAFEECESERVWSRAEIDASKAAASILGSAISGTRALKVRSATMSISDAAHMAQDLGDLFKSIHAIVAEMMFAENFYIAIYDDAADIISFPYDVDQFDEPFPPHKPERGLTEYVLRSGKPLLASPDVFEDLVKRGEVDSIGAPSIDWLGVPLKAKDKTIGVLAVQSYTEGVRFGEEEKAILTFVSTQIAMAIERKRADDALRESEEQYRTLVRNIPIGIYRSVPFDRERILMANKAFLTMFGFDSEDEAKEASMEDLYLKPDEHKVFMEILEARGEVYAFEARLRRKDDTIIWGAITAQVVKATQDSLSYFDCAIEDITVRTSRSQEREALISFSAILKTAQTRSETVAAILDYVRILFNAEGNALVLRDDGGGRYWIEAARGYWDYLGERRLQFDPSLSQKIISSGSLYSDWVKRDPLYGLPMPAGQRRMAVCVPLTTENKSIGAIWLSRQDAFGESDVQLLAAISDMAANALHRMLLHEQTQRRVQRLSALRAVDMAISASMDLRVVFNVLLEQLRTQLHVDAASVLLLRPQMQTLEHTASRGFQTNLINQTRLRLSDRLVGRAILEHRTLRVDNLAEQAEDFLRVRGLSSEGFVVYYIAPLVVKGQLVGALELFHRSELFPDKEWLDFLDMLAGQAAIAIDNATLFNDLQRSNMDLHLAYDTTLEGWVNALDLRVGEGTDHTKSITEVTVNLARRMGVVDSDLVHVRRGALLHDIGKMAIPDTILLKPGPLADDEWQLMKRHPEFARDLLWPTGYLRPAVDIPYCHHERWDGTGYPRGLAGTDIPLAARVFTVVDVWDALCSDRPYRKAWPDQAVHDYLAQQSGKQFDPEVVSVFFKAEQEGQLQYQD